MKIALISPAGAMHRHNGSFALPLHYAPLTLTTLAALIPDDIEAEVALYDETVQPIPYDLEADLVGITAITGTSMRAYRLADYLRSRGICVVLGGVHPTLLPEEAAQHADAVVVGFAEQTWPQLLRDFRQGQLQKFYHMATDFDVAGKPVAFRHMLKRRKYITLNSVEATRGCLHTCNFCVIPAAWGRHLYRRPVREVVAEIEQLPGKEVIFIDANLIADPSYAEELFREMIPLKRWWFGLVTALIGKNDKLLQLMAQSGCKGVLIGFESITPPSLSSINKSFNQAEEYRLLIQRMHDLGIAINGTFVFGTDADDKSVFERMVERIIELKIDLPRYAILTPFPKTSLYRELEQQGRIIERDWSLYDVEHCVFRPAKMTPEELEQGLEWAWRETYSLSSIRKRLTSPGIQRFLLNVPLNFGYRAYAKKLSYFTKHVMMDHSDIPESQNNENHVHTAGHR